MHLLVKEHPVAWDQEHMTTLKGIFPNIWVAASFKGKEFQPLCFFPKLTPTGNAGSGETVPDAADNMLDNGEIIHALPDFLSTASAFHGVVLLGRQRHEHFSRIGEQFVAAIPNLALQLGVFKNAALDEEDISESRAILNCQSDFHAQSTAEFLTNDHLLQDFENCNFPGARLFSVMVQVHILRYEISQLHDWALGLNGEMTSFHLLKGYFSRKLRERKDEFTELSKKLKAVGVLLKQYLPTVYDEFVEDEIRQTILVPLRKRVHEMTELFDSPFNEYWEKRPLNYAEISAVKRHEDEHDEN